MEDPGEEWEIEEYSPCLIKKESENRVSWILNRGLWLGRKVAITGFVMSSAPLVLPPLAVVSALGFAVSVPFGIVFASYTCTEKLMSKLLPMPESSSMLECGKLLLYGEDEDETVGGQFAIEEEEKKQIEETKEEIRMRIELEVDGNEEQRVGDVLLDVHDNSPIDIAEAEPRKVDKDDSFKENGNEKNVDEYMEGDDEGSLGEKSVEIEGSGDIVGKESLIKDRKNEKPATLVQQVVVVVEEQKQNVKNADDELVLARGVPGETGNAVKMTENRQEKEKTTGLLEKIRNMGNSGQSLKKNKNKHKHHLKKSHGVGVKEKAESVTSAKEIEKPFEIGREKLNSPVPGTDRLDSRKGVEKTTQEDKGKSKPTVQMEGVILENLDDRNNPLIAENPIGYHSISIDGNHADENLNLVEKEMKPEAERKAIILETGMETGVVCDRQENFEPERKEGKAIQPIVDIKGTAGNGDLEESMTDEHLEFPENSIETGLPIAKHNGAIPKVEVTISSNKILPNEEKLWEQINAMRVIVGYKAARQPSILEELKALYIFTGVEPPSSFENSTSIGDAKDKLCFLMSVVGVK